MEYPMTETGSLFTSGIKRNVKDKRMSKTAKLNVSLASKIKTKIINNSSIFKISLKHNNRALAQALSREKENSRRMTTEKMLLQKEVEKLNFENTFLRLKLNNLNKKLIEIEAHMNNNLITAIEMSTLSEFHQSPFLLPASKNKRVSKQCKSMRLPFARVPLTSNDDDDEEEEDKVKMQCDNIIISKTSLDVPSSVSTRQSLSTQYNLELSCLKENNQNVCSLDDSEHISSIVDILPKEIYAHSDQSSKNSVMSEMKNSQSINHRQEKPSLNNITKRKRHASFLESNNPADNPCVTDLDQEGISSPELNWNNEINDHTNEMNIKIQRNIQCLPDSSESVSEPTGEHINQVQGDDDFQGQKTVYDADMDLTASEVVGQIVTVSTGTKNKSNTKRNDCGIKTFRKVRDSGSEKKKERSKRQIKNSSEMNVEEKIDNEAEKRPVGLNGNQDSEDPNSDFSTEQLTQLNKLKTITLHNDLDQDDKQSTDNRKKKKKKKKKIIHITDEEEETYSFSQSTDKFHPESKFDIGQSSQAHNKNKTFRQTFVIHNLEKGQLFLNEKVKTISENLEVTNEFQTADLATKHNGNLCDYETQNMLDLKKQVTDTQPAQQIESKINKKLRQKANRKTEIISEMNQIYGDNDKDVHGPEKGNFFIQTQEDKEVISGNLAVSNEFQGPALYTSNNGNLRDCEPQNVLGLQKLVTNAFPVQQNKSKVNNLRQRVNRKTVILSEVKPLYKDENMYCLENGNPFFLNQKDKEIISENLENPSESQTPALSTKVGGNLSDYETQNISGVKEHVRDMQTACQNELKIEKKLRQKVCRKTEIISEINQIHENDDKDMHDTERGNLFPLTQKDNEIIPENLEDSNEFQVVDPFTRGNRKLCGYETGNICGEKKQVTNMPPTKQNESKINKRLRDKGNQKTEIILEMNQINELYNKGVHDPENGHFFSPTQKDKETVSENPQVTNEFQTAYFSSRDNGNLYDYETLSMLDLKKHVTDTQPAQQNDSKINKKLRQKVSRKTEIISEMYQIYRGNDKDLHGQESCAKDLDFKINECKQRLECQGIINEYCMEISSNEKENYELISDPYKQVKKHGKESSGKTKNILTKGKNKPIFQLTDSSQTSLSSESGLKHVTNEADSDSDNQMEPHKKPKQSTATLNKKRDIPFVEVIKGECQVKRGNKMTSESKKRKTLIDPSPGSHEAVQIISDTSQKISVESEQADEERKLENEKIKPDFYTKVSSSLSQIYSPSIKDSSPNSVHEHSRPLSISSSKNLIRENFALESSPIFQVSDDMQKMTGMKFKVNQRTQRSGIGGRTTLQDLTNTNFVSNNTAKSENKSEDLSLELPKRRRCTPLNFKEPSLRDKMRR